MPINKRYFDLGINNTIAKYMKEIHSFLAEHKDEAYSKSELIEGLLPSSLPFPIIHPPHEIALFEEALSVLEKLGAVETKEIAREFYYIYKGELPEGF